MGDRGPSLASADGRRGGLPVRVPDQNGPLPALKPKVDRASEVRLPPSSPSCQPQEAAVLLIVPEVASVSQAAGRRKAEEEKGSVQCRTWGQAQPLG